MNESLDVTSEQEKVPPDQMVAELIEARMQSIDHQTLIRYASFYLKRLYEMHPQWELEKKYNNYFNR